MKKSFLLITSTFYSIFCIAQVDLSQLEMFINDTIGEVSDYFDFVEKTELVIDKENSNLSLGKLSVLAYVKTIALKSNNNSPLELAVNLDVDIDPKEHNNPSLIVGSEINGAIQVVSLLNSVSNTFGPCELIPVNPDTTAAEHNQNILCMLMTTFGEIKSVPELLLPLINIKEYAQAAFPNTSENAKTISKILKSLKLEVVEGILLAEADITLGSDLNGKLITSILNNSIKVNVNGLANLAPEDVEKRIKLVEEVAQNLMDKESDAYLVFEDNLYLILGVLEAFLVTDEY